MGWRWVWGAKDDRGAAPTRWVGESAVTSSGCSVSRSDSSRSSPVVLGVGDLGLVEDVVAVVRVVQRLAQRLRPRRRGLEILSHAPILPGLPRPGSLSKRQITWGTVVGSMETRKNPLA